MVFSLEVEQGLDNRGTGPGRSLLPFFFNQVHILSLQKLSKILNLK